VTPWGSVPGLGRSARRLLQIGRSVMRPCSVRKIDPHESVGHRRKRVPLAATLYRHHRNPRSVPVYTDRSIRLDEQAAAGAIDYLHEETPVLREESGKRRLRFNDDLGKLVGMSRSPPSAIRRFCWSDSTGFRHWNSLSAPVRRLTIATHRPVYVAPKLISRNHVEGTQPNRGGVGRGMGGPAIPETAGR
jgi:hypothetical protein